MVKKNKEKPSIMELAGCLKDDPETIKVFENVIKDRKKFKLRDIRF